MDNKNLKYGQYLNDTKLLARSLSIYFTVSAELLNTFVTSVAGANGVNQFRRETWKYHLNLCGEYHPLDTPIKVKSLDTMEEIVFNKANLKLHRGTAKYYSFGSPGHDELLSRLPGRTLLINGIICPAKMEDVLAAKDGDLLALDESLIEEHELTLRSKLATWISTQHHARYNSQYALVHDYYHSQHVASIMMTSIKQILNLRVEACKTSEAHSYHIMAHLASNGKLHRYMPYMTRYQQLWLYRNIEYINNHCGIQDTFDWLTENLLTIRGIPLAKYRMNHLLDNQPDALKPDIGYMRIPINNIQPAMTDLPRSLDTLMKLEDPLATDNQRLRPWYTDPTYSALQDTKSSTMPTKVLESAMVDTSSTLPYQLAVILLNEWAHLSSIGYYTAYVPIDHPISGEKFYLTAKDAFILFWYAFNRSRGKKLEYVEDVFVSRAAMVPKQEVTDITTRVEGLGLRKADLESIDILPDVEPQISIAGFYEYCDALWHKANAQFFILAEHDRSDRRAHLEYAVSQHFFDGFASMASTQVTYADWFSTNNIRLQETDDKESWTTFYQTLFVAGTGIEDDETISMKNVQHAMISMMRQLSSYTIQFIEEFQGEGTIPLCLVSPRYGLAYWRDKSSAYCDFSIEIGHTHITTYSHAVADMGKVSSSYKTRAYDDIYFDAGVKLGSVTSKNEDVYIADMGMDVIYTGEHSVDMSGWPIDRINRYVLAHGHCEIPVEDTRPSSSKLFLIRDVADLNYPPL